MSPRLGLLLLITGLSLALMGRTPAAELETQLYPSYRAEALLPIIQPLVGPVGSVSAYQGQLVIRATAAQQAEIAALLQQLDRPLRNVQISVRRSGMESSRERGIDSDIRLRYPQGRIGVDIHDHRQSTQSNTMHMARTLENSATFIDTGSAIAVPAIQYGPGGMVVGQTYQSLMQGFEATPQILPDGRIRLELRYRHDSPESGRQITSQSADTVLMLEPGRWTSLGGAEESQHSQSSGILSQGSRTSSRQLPLEIKVDILD